jgi:choline dehydrogenase-like flavoprotein
MAAIEDVADYVIVGTGAGGATAARVLAAAGHDVVLLDEGPRLRTADRPRDLLGAMRQSFRDFGTSATVGALPLPLLQGRCVGGSTAINSGIIWRTPGDVLTVWRDEWGLAELADERALADAFDVIERELEITETARSVWGGNSDLMARGAEALGLPGKPISRNAARCQGNAQCLQGCPGEARQSMDVSYVPRALRDGARLHALARVDRVVFEGTRAVGVEDTVLLETHLHDVLPGDTYLMCSDGLSDMLDDESIAQLLQSSDALTEVAAALVDAANDAGGKDNISVVLARVRGPAGPARSWWPFRR